ncbi:MAG: putative Ig domain-containing protein, partial [Chloroflexota bacterium]
MKKLLIVAIAAFASLMLMGGPAYANQGPVDLSANPTFDNVPTNQTSTVGVADTYTITATDPDGQTPITYAASNLPPGITINSGTGEMSGTPTTAGSYTVNFSATDTNAE